MTPAGEQNAPLSSYKRSGTLLKAGPTGHFPWLSPLHCDYFSGIALGKMLESPRANSAQHATTNCVWRAGACVVEYTTQAHACAAPQRPRRHQLRSLRQNFQILAFTVPEINLVPFALVGADISRD